MLKSRICALFILMLSLCKLSAQVNLQTGSAVFSLPMFNWQDNKSRLNSNIALSYNSGNGLKCNDIASNVGQGWSLLAGGMITRLQVGEPDDQPSYGSGEDINQYPAGYLFATVPAQNGCPSALSKYPIYNPMNHLYAQHNITAEDKQMDRFAFQFNGKAGMFVLDAKAKNGTDVCVVLGDSKIKITFTRDYNLATTEKARTVITAFTIQDVDGLIYKFTKHSLTKVLKTDYCDDKLTQAQTQPNFKGGKVYYQSSFDNITVNPYIIDGWYLTEVFDPLTSRRITLTYTQRTLNNTGGSDISYNQSKDYSIITYKKSIVSIPVLTSINFPDTHAVTFNYGNERTDLKGDYALASVDIKYGSRSLSQYKLNTTYFILNRYGTPVSDYQKSVARLCLKSVTKIGVDLKDDSPPYIFDYYLGSGNGDDYVPPPFNYAKDIWGFYNGYSSIDYDNAAIPLSGNISQLNNSQLKGLCYLRKNVSGITLNPKQGYAKNGLLKQIIYPTGGTLSYQYDQNSGPIDGAQTVVGGVHVSATSATDGGYSNDCDHPLVTNYNYLLSTGTSSLWGLEMPVNMMQMSSHYEPEKRGWHMGWKCITGCCYWEYQYPGILSQSGAISLTAFQQFMNTIAPVLGILSAITTVLDIINICLDATPLAIVAIVLDVIAGVAVYILSCKKNSKDDTATIYYNADLNSVSPLPAQFKRVEVTESSGAGGKTVNEFTSSDDYAIWYPTNPVFSAKQRFAPWAYGLLKKATVYDASGNKVKETENVYDFGKAQAYVDPCNNTGLQVTAQPTNPLPSCPGYTMPTNLQNCKCLIKYSTSQRNTDWEDPAKYNNDTYQKVSDANIGVDIYGLFSGRTELKTTYDRTYKSGDGNTFTQNQTDYYYNYINNYDVARTETKLSNGDKIVKFINYNSSYSAGVLAILSSNNIFSIPVETYEYQVKPSGEIKYTKSNVVEFLQATSGDIKPYRMLEQRFASPQPTINWYGGPGSDISSYKITQLYTYDATGNTIGLKDEGGRTVTNIYGYNDAYVIASVINADPVTDKPAYTSFETPNAFGGWTLNGTPAYSSSAITGNTSFSLGGNSFTANINTAKSYIVSLWASLGVTVSSGTLAKSGPTINGLTYYEYNVPQGTASVTVSGNANIDELRLYPKNARMRTVTYDPLIGKTSVCDENNRIVYYEYDNLGRLQFEKDENKNIVKMHEYNNVSTAKQNGCPKVYYNNLITEIFTKSNCGAGYAGKDITYSVPANKYSSPLSQWHADIQAQQELMVNGQANADNTSIANGCSLIYYNDQQSQSFTSGTCGIQYIGGAVNYTVPANKYSSLISKADANQRALDEIDANGQVYANDSAHSVCTLNTQPEWQWNEGDSAYCLTVNGQLPAHQFGYALDINPNSTTYNQRQWKDMGPQDACPANTYFNAEQSKAFIKNDCSGGSSVTYTVAPGTYSSIVSQADADQLATNDINANGQTYANAKGTCCTPTFSWVNGYSGSVAEFSLQNSNQANFTLVVNNSPSITGYARVGQLSGSCVFPKNTCTVPVLINGSSTYYVTVTSSGEVGVQYGSGPTVSGSLVLHSSYGINACGFYNNAKNVNYTRNNCPSGQVGSTVSYSVPAYKYFSTISQADADQQAQSECDAQGQNNANASGTCDMPFTIPCSFTWSSSAVSKYATQVNSNGTSVKFSLVYSVSGPTYTGGVVGTLGGCRPTTTRIFNITDGTTGTKVWTVTVSASGTISISLYSGSSAVMGPVSLSGIYNL